MIKLNLRQNALHTIYHAIEHLGLADKSDEDNSRSFDPDTGIVEWKDQDGRLCFIRSEFTRPPVIYNLKFALLHLIQGSELLLKAYVEQCESTAVFVDANSRRTIGLHKALNFVVERNPDLLTPREITLLLEAKELRNSVEHYQFNFIKNDLKELCVDFLAVCILLAQKLLSINIVETFTWDYLRDKPDQVGDCLSAILSYASETGLLAAKKAGELWTEGNPSQRAFLCLNCGARAVFAEQNLCMGCGAEGDEDTAGLIEGLEDILRRTAELKARR